MVEQRRVVSIISLVIFIIFSIILYLGLVRHNRIAAQAIELADENIDTTINLVEKFSFAPYTARIISMLGSSPGAVQAFAEQDKQQLYKLVRKRFQSLLKESQYFNGMTFYLPDGSCFLQLSRQNPTLDAEHSHETCRITKLNNAQTSGYEIIADGPMFKVVQPVFFQDTYIGSFELLVHIHQIIDVLQKQIKQPVTSFFLDSEWQNYKKGAQAQRIYFGKNVLITHNQPIYQKLPSDFKLELDNQQITINDQIFIAHTHKTFNNFQGKHIGGLLLLQDISNAVQQKNSFIIKVVLAAAFLYILSFFIIYLYFQRIISSVVKKGKEKEESEKRAVNESLYLQSILNSSVDTAICATDSKLRINYFNPEAERIFNMPAKQVMGKTVIDIHKSIGLGKTTRFHEVMHMVKELGSHHFILKPGGKLNRIIDTRISAIFNQEKQFSGYILLGHDVTEKMKIEAEHKLLKEQVIKSQKMESLGLMVGGVAHDLNNILLGVIAYPEILLKEIPPQSELYEPIKNIRDSGKRAAAIVADLLTLARGIAAPKEPRNLNALIIDYVNSAEGKTLLNRFQNVQCKLDLDNDLLNTVCSDVHIRKVMMNLIINGLEAIVDQGTVTIKTQNLYVDTPVVQNQLLEKGEYVAVSVSDTGHGIDDEDIERIFEPFYTNKVLGKSGTGLGLAVVWGTIAEHNGIINVDSDTSGTTFTFYLPATRDQLELIPDNSKVDDLYGNGESILVIDDEIQQLDICSKMLTHLGYSVKTAASGEEAVEHCKRHTVDLLILDMIMPPGISGRETYEQIISIHPGQKALICSGFSETADVKRVQELGAGQLIKKPYLLRDLGFSVKQILES